MNNILLVKFFRFMASISGRIIRVILGMVILAFGFEMYPLLIPVGLIPLLAGIFDVCVLAPIFGLPFAGVQLRKR